MARIKAEWAELATWKKYAIIGFGIAAITFFGLSYAGVSFVPEPSA